jgi:hypothetical protein
MPLPVGCCSRLEVATTQCHRQYSFRYRDEAEITQQNHWGVAAGPFAFSKSSAALLIPAATFSMI